MIWDCLFDSRKMRCLESYERFQVEPISGHPYRMFDGNVSGTFISANLHHSAKFTWRHASWPSGHFSTVEMKFDDLHGEGRILFEQTEVPTSELERTREKLESIRLVSYQSILGILVAFKDSFLW